MNLSLTLFIGYQRMYAQQLYKIKTYCIQLSLDNCQMCAKTALTEKKSKPQIDDEFLSTNEQVH